MYVCIYVCTYSMSSIRTYSVCAAHCNTRAGLYVCDKGICCEGHNMGTYASMCMYVYAYTVRTYVPMLYICCVHMPCYVYVHAVAYT